jgi:hypothetical protein
MVTRMMKMSKEITKEQFHEYLSSMPKNELKEYLKNLFNQGVKDSVMEIGLWKV